MRNKEIRGNLLELQVSACGVSYLDLEMKNGKYKNLHGPLPHVLGYEITGRVCRIGEDVSRFSVGDSVAGKMLLHQQVFIKFNKDLFLWTKLAETEIL